MIENRHRVGFQREGSVVRADIVITKVVHSVCKGGLEVGIAELSGMFWDLTAERDGQRR